MSKEVDAMNIVRWSPWRRMETFSDRMNRLFDDSHFPTVWVNKEMDLSNWKPVVDIYDHDDKISIKAELPGIDKKDVEVDLKDGVLTIKGERTYENEVNEDKYYRKERAFGKFHRSFHVPADVDPEKITADFKDGILHLEIPKPEENKPKKITVH
jgi:HSP20 family protein